MIVVEESAEACIVYGANVHLEFRYVGDRWQHFISVRLNGDWSRLLISEEGSPDARDLPSPALQDLRLERFSDDVVEFQLLGQAGAGVYSAAVRFDGKAPEIDFDLSVRGRSSESRLCMQSGYRIGNNGSTVPVDGPLPNSLTVRLQSGPGVALVPVPIPGHPPTTCRVLAEKSAGRIAAGLFDSMQPDPKNKGVTVRWRYRITPLRHP